MLNVVLTWNSISPSISPWGMPLVNICSLHYKTLFFQPFHTTRLPQTALCSSPIQSISLQPGYQDTMGDHVESLAEVTENNTHHSPFVCWDNYLSVERNQVVLVWFAFGKSMLVHVSHFLFLKPYPSIWRITPTRHMRRTPAVFVPWSSVGDWGWGWLPLLPHIFLALLEDNRTFIF